MAIVLNCWESAVANSSSSLTITKPTSSSVNGDSPKNVAAGDLLIIIVGSDDSSDTAQWDNSTNKPTGFTLIAEGGNSTVDCHVAAFYKVATGSEGSSFSVPSASSNDYWGFCVLLSGTDTLHLTGSVVADDTPPIAITGVTTTIADCLAFYVAAFDGGDFEAFSVSGTGWAERAEIYTDTGGLDAGGTWGTRLMSGTGATGTATVTPTNSDGMVGFQFAISPSGRTNVVLNIICNA